MERWRLPLRDDSLCLSAILTCLVLSVVYVASLYVWNSPHPRYIRLFVCFAYIAYSPARIYTPLNYYRLYGSQLHAILHFVYFHLPRSFFPLFRFYFYFLHSIQKITITRYDQHFFVRTCLRFPRIYEDPDFTNFHVFFTLFFIIWIPPFLDTLL